MEFVVSASAKCNLLLMDAHTDIDQQIDFEWVVFTCTR